MGPRLGNGISPCYFAFLRGGIWQAIPEFVLLFGENFMLLVKFACLPCDSIHDVVIAEGQRARTSAFGAVKVSFPIRRLIAGNEAHDFLILARCPRRWLYWFCWGRWRCADIALQVLNLNHNPGILTIHVSMLRDFWRVLRPRYLSSINY